MLHYLLTISFNQMRTKFRQYDQKWLLETVFVNKNFLDYLKEIYPSQLTDEEANESDHLADYSDFTSQAVFVGFQPDYMTNMMILTSTLSIFHSFPATYHLTFLWYKHFATHKVCVMLLTL